MKVFLLLITELIFFTVNNVSSQKTSINYFNQPVPDKTPKLFAPAIISNGLTNRDFAISPDGNEIFYTVQQKDFLASTIIHCKEINGKWSNPEVASFSGRYNDLEAAFSPDGTKVYFSSNRPSAANDTIDDFDIWYVTKEKGEWGNAVHLSDKVNSSQNEFYPSITKSGNLYFTLEMEGGKGKEDIVICQYINGGYEKPESLPEAVNSKGYEFNAFVDPDEQFILFTGYRRADDLGGGDLYLSKKDAEVNWITAKHLEAPINSNKIDYCPFVSWDKKYLFFTSSRTGKALPFNKKKNLSEIKNILANAGNGFDDIYWVSFEELLK